MFKGGVKEAAKMLALLGGDAQKKLLEEIRIKDPQMAQSLEDNLVSLDDLQHLTTAMLIGLLRDVDLEEFGLALRGLEPHISSKILEMVSTGIRLDIEDGFKGKPRSVSEVEIAQAKVLDVLKKKITMGHILIDPNGSELV